MKTLISSLRELSVESKILIVLYSFIAIKMNIIDFSLTPDEIKFIEWAESIQWFQTPSPEYFGQIYWFLLKLISTVTPSFLYPELAKIIFAGLLYLGLLSCIFFTKDSKSKFYCLALALTSPLFYWNGKMIGPEILSVSLVFFGLAYYSIKKYKVSFLIIGIAVGAKLTVLPVLAYIFVIELLKRTKIRDVFIYGFLIFLGFLIANPTDNFSLIMRLADTRGDSTTEIIPFAKSLWGSVFNFRPKHMMTWDLILHNNFQDITFYWFTYILILYGALLTNKRLFLSYLSFLIFHFFWIIKGNSGLGFPWYWMTLVPVTLHVFSNLNLELLIFKHRYFSKLNLGILIILCSLIQSSSTIVFQIHQKQYQKQNLVDFGDDYLCFIRDYKREDLKVLKRVGFEKESKFQFPTYDYSMEPIGDAWKNKTGKDFYLLISSRFLYGETFSQNILKNRNQLLGRCGDVLIFKIYSQ
ncbi:hypothetical protein N9M18_02250 [Candidatus Pseudothioglobus singularis]|nr:hypothetical protein [Candidatus Pseudothioglobus singularis]